MDRAVKHLRATDAGNMILGAASLGVMLAVSGVNLGPLASRVLSGLPGLRSPSALQKPDHPRQRMHLANSDEQASALQDAAESALKEKCTY